MTSFDLDLPDDTFWQDGMPHPDLPTLRAHVQPHPCDDGRPPASDTVIEFVGLLAIAIAIGAVYVGARRTRQDRPGDANAAPTDPRPQSKKRRR
ncbi:MAG: hypothetical protein Q8L12_17975 [Methylibium sp.]|nr:hypothetical protein [Methylibium sp.]